jgi:hypothetical protein
LEFTNPLPEHLRERAAEEAPLHSLPGGRAAD